MSNSDSDKPDENEVLKRMLAMPPKPHEFGEGKTPDATKTKGKAPKPKKDKPA